MRAIFCDMLVLAAILLPAAATVAQGVPDLLSPSRQLLVVTTADWSATEGTLRRFEWHGTNWQPVGAPVPVVIGRSGLAWGRGLNPPSATGPQKHEGDGKSPAGIFRLPSAFGYAPPQDVPYIKLPYVQCTGAIECVDDPTSANYNRIVNSQSVPKRDWNSSEKMRMVDNEYELGVFVAHNSDPPAPGGGSCIFLHVWPGPHGTTSGCTAMTLASIRGLLQWLDPQANPLLVQLPADQYKRLQREWELPKLTE